MFTLVDRFINDEINGGVFKDGLPMLVSSRRKADGTLGMMLISADCLYPLFELLNTGEGYEALVDCEWFPYVEALSMEDALAAMEIKLTKVERDVDGCLYSWVQRVSDVQWAATNPDRLDTRDALEEIDLTNSYDFVRELYRTPKEVV